LELRSDTIARRFQLGFIDCLDAAQAMLQDAHPLSLLTRFYRSDQLRKLGRRDEMGSYCGNEAMRIGFEHLTKSGTELGRPIGQLAAFEQMESEVIGVLVFVVGDKILEAIPVIVRRLSHRHASVTDLEHFSFMVAERSLHKIMQEHRRRLSPDADNAERSSYRHPDNRDCEFHLENLRRLNDPSARPHSADL
jgi:hypothetical protein